MPMTVWPWHKKRYTCSVVSTFEQAQAGFAGIIASGRVKPLPLPARSPNLNAYAERWVRSVKEECLSRVILFGERSLRRALSEYVDHFHTERNHQGKGNVLLFPLMTDRQREGPVQCRERLGGLLRYYHREAA
jgi:putative transposase